MVGLVQGRDQWRESAGRLSERLRVAGVEWLLAGLRCEAGAASIGGAASLQWSSGAGPAIRIGDAAVARDALAAQGIANGISAGLSLFESPDGERSYPGRTKTEFLSHLSTLQELARNCAYREHPFWEGYADFLGHARRGHADASWGKVPDASP
jgi:hypothetical protein